MRILFINHHGGGFAAEIDVAEGLTVRQLFDERMQSESAEDYLIRVNRQPAAEDQLLQPGDRVSFTPRKIEGAGLTKSQRFPALRSQRVIAMRRHV